MMMMMILSPVDAVVVAVEFNDYGDKDEHDEDKQIGPITMMLMMMLTHKRTDRGITVWPVRASIGSSSSTFM